MTGAAYPFADLALARRLERAEGTSCAAFAEASAKAIPGRRAEWTEVAGAYAMFDGPNSPVTQTFGLGMFQPPTGPTSTPLRHSSATAGRRCSTRSARSPTRPRSRC